MTYFESQLHNILEDNFDDLLGDEPVDEPVNDQDEFDYPYLWDAGNNASTLAEFLNHEQVIAKIQRSINESPYYLIAYISQEDGTDYTKDIDTNSYYTGNEFIRIGQTTHPYWEWIQEAECDDQFISRINDLIEEYMIELRGQNGRHYYVCWVPGSKWKVRQ